MSIASPISYLGVGDGATADFLDLRDESRYGFGRPNFSNRGQISVPVHFRGVTSNDMAQNYQRLARKLRQAEKAWWERDTSQIVRFTWQPRTTEPVYFPVMGGTLTPLHINPFSKSGECTLLLNVLPYPHGTTTTDTVTGTLTNGSAQFLRANVLGDHPALVKMVITDTSSAGVINRIRLALRSQQTIDALGDYDPWVDPIALSPGVAQADATCFGGTYIHDTVNAADWSNLARLVMPSGSLNRGRRDLWARIWDTATAMGQPTSGSATVDPPVVASSSMQQYDTVQVGATGVSALVTGGAVVTLSQATTAGSLLLAVGTVQEESVLSGTLPTSSGTTWKHLVSQASSGEVTDRLAVAIYYARNVPAGVTTVSWNVGGVSSDQLHVVEFLDADLAIDVASVLDTTNTIEPVGPTIPDTSFNNEVVFVALGTPDQAGADEDFWYAGYDGITDDDGTLTAWRTSAQPETPPVPKVRLLGTAPLYIMLTANIKPQRSEVTTTTVEEPTPGDVRAGTYAFRVQAVDPVGALSNASASINATVTLDRSAIALSWTAPSGTVAYYKITYSIDGRYYYFYTSGNATSYTLTSTDGHPETTALPATTGAVGSPGQLRVRLGTAGSLSETLSEAGDIRLTGAGVWRMVRIASAKDLPPVGQHRNGDQPEWAIELQVRSSNGLDAEIRVDALWVIPHDEWQATLEYPTLGLTDLSVWVVESDLTGRSLTGWLEDISIATETGRVVCAGSFLLEPGDNIIMLLLEQADEVLSFDTSCTVELSITPRYDWIDGLLE